MTQINDKAFKEILQEAIEEDGDVLDERFMEEIKVKQGVKVNEELVVH